MKPVHSATQPAENDPVNLQQDLDVKHFDPLSNCERCKVLSTMDASDVWVVNLKKLPSFLDVGCPIKQQQIHVAGTKLFNVGLHRPAIYSAFLVPPAAMCLVQTTI